MARPRTDLANVLNAILTSVDPKLGTGHCYFRTPSKLEYPCIKYEVVGDFNFHADNKRYLGYNRYTVTVIDEDPDSIIAKLVADLPMCSLNRAYEADNLNHFVYNLYF